MMTENTSQNIVVVVDGTVVDYESLLTNINPNATVIVLSDEQHGLDGLAAALAGHDGIDELHLVTEGASGTLYLSGVAVTESTVGQYTAQWAEIGSHLSDGADLLLRQGLRPEHRRIARRTCRRRRLDRQHRPDPPGRRLGSGIRRWCGRQHPAFFSGRHAGYQSLPGV